MKIPNTTVAIIVKNTSLLSSFFLTLIGAKSAEAPRISRIFAILLPSTFPIVIPVAPLRLELTFTTSSGAEVPKATMVSPMIISEIQNFFANEEEPSTRRSAPLIRKIKPRRKRRSVSRCMI